MKASRKPTLIPSKISTGTKQSHLLHKNKFWSPRESPRISTEPRRNRDSACASVARGNSRRLSEISKKDRNIKIIPVQKKIIQISRDRQRGTTSRRNGLRHADCFQNGLHLTLSKTRRLIEKKHENRRRNQKSPKSQITA